MARPSKLDDATHAAIVLAIAEGVPRSQAAAAVGVSPRTARRWLQQGSDDAAADNETPHRALLEDIETAEAQLHRRAVGVVLAQLGSEDPDVAFRAARLYLERRHPDEWSQRREIRATGPDGGPVQVEARAKVERVDPLFTDAQIREMTPAQLHAAILGLRETLDDEGIDEAMPINPDNLCYYEREQLDAMVDAHEGRPYTGPPHRPLLRPRQIGTMSDAQLEASIAGISGVPLAHALGTDADGGLSPETMAALDGPKATAALSAMVRDVAETVSATSFTSDTAAKTGPAPEAPAPEVSPEDPRPSPIPSRYVSPLRRR